MFEHELLLARLESILAGIGTDELEQLVMFAEKLDTDEVEVEYV